MKAENEVLKIEKQQENYLKISMNGKIYIIDGTNDCDNITVYNESVESYPELIHSTDKATGEFETITKFDEATVEGKRLHPQPWDMVNKTANDFFSEIKVRKHR